MSLLILGFAVGLLLWASTDVGLLWSHWLMGLLCYRMALHVGDIDGLRKIILPRSETFISTTFPRSDPDYAVKYGSMIYILLSPPENMHIATSDSPGIHF